MILDSVLLSWSLSCLYITMDYLVHLQYDYTSDFTFWRFLSRHLPFGLTLFGFVYLTTLYKSRWWMRLGCAIGSLFAGCLLIHYSQNVQTFGYIFNLTRRAMLKTPGLAILWIYLIIQMDLLPSLLSLAGSMIFYYKDFLLPDPTTVFKGL